MVMHATRPKCFVLKGAYTYCIHTSSYLDFLLMYMLGVCTMFIIICIVGTFAQLFTKFARMYEVLINCKKIVYLFFPVHITACSMLVKIFVGPNESISLQSACTILYE